LDIEKNKIHRINNKNNNKMRELIEFKMFDFQDYQYSISLYFGSNKEKLTLDLDTGSSDLWIATSKCKQCSKWMDQNNNQVDTFN